MKHNQDPVRVAILKGLMKVSKHHTLYLPGEIGVQAMERDAELILVEVNKALDMQDDRGGADRE